MASDLRISIQPSPTADTRTCDWSKVDREQLLASSLQHKQDIAKAIGLFQTLLTEAAVRHDHDKLHAIDHFHSDFRTGFKQTGWWDRHRKINRHHLTESAWQLDRETGQLRIDMTAAGPAEGSYSLLWEAKASGLGKPLGVGSVREQLPAGAVHLLLMLDAGSLARRYAEGILSRSEAVQIDVTLALELSLVPVGLSGQEEPLRLKIPLTFSYRPDGAVEFYSAQL